MNNLTSACCESQAPADRTASDAKIVQQCEEH